MLAVTLCLVIRSLDLNLGTMVRTIVLLHRLRDHVFVLYDLSCESVRGSKQPVLHDQSLLGHEIRVGSILNRRMGSQKIGISIW